LHFEGLVCALAPAFGLASRDFFCALLLHELAVPFGDAPFVDAPFVTAPFDFAAIALGTFGTFGGAVIGSGAGATGVDAAAAPKTSCAGASPSIWSRCFLLIVCRAFRVAFAFATANARSSTADEVDERTDQSSRARPLREDEARTTRAVAS
jgi:hypothetical protein